MDRIPKPPPFPVGTTLRYRGTRRSWYEENGVRVPIIEPGLIVQIEKTNDGRRGTLRQIRDEDGPAFYEDTGAPILDTTRDGYSVYYASNTTKGRQMGRIIDHETMADWEVIST